MAPKEIHYSYGIASCRYIILVR